VAPSFAEPLVAPPDGHDWTMRMSTNSRSTGDTGTPPVVTDDGWPYFPVRRRLCWRQRQAAAAGLQARGLGIFSSVRDFS